MPTFFLFNNLHLALELVEALVFLMISWLAFDAWSVKRDLSTALRGVGFGLLAILPISHAFIPTADLTLYVTHSLYLLGLLAVLVNHLLERPLARMGAGAAVISLSFAGAATLFNSAATVLLAAITFLAYRHYRLEQNKALLSFWWGFAALAIASLLETFSGLDEAINSLWLIRHLLELSGCILLFRWVWQYLALRVREEIVLIFVSMALLIASVVTVAFSTILVSRVNQSALANLTTNTRVMDLSIQDRQNEALAKIKLLARDPDLASLLSSHRLTDLQSLLEKSKAADRLDFIVITDEVGGVVLRIPGVAQANENIRQTALGEAALSGKTLVTIDGTGGPGLSIGAAAPLLAKDKVIGAVVGGYLLDNAFVDGIKTVTGLETAIYQGDTRVASTEFNPGSATRNVGIKEVNKRVTEEVLIQGRGIALETTIQSRPYLASFLPLKDAQGKIIGMLAAGEPQREILDIATKTNQLTLLTVTIIMLILIIPIYLVTKRLAE